MKTLIAKRKDDEGFWVIPCPKRSKEVEHAGPSVAVYVCIGSLIRGIDTCPHMQVGTTGAIGAEIECLWPERARFKNSICNTCTRKTAPCASNSTVMCDDHQLEERS